MTWETYSKAFEHTFPRGCFPSQKRGGGLAMHLACRHGHEEIANFGALMPPHKVKATLAKRGWVFGGNKATCPQHNEEKTMNTMKGALTEALAVPSEAAKRAKREALRWLEEAFDTGKGCYKPSFSDASVAAETGLSQTEVERLRADFGYDLKEPEEVAQWRAEIAELRKQLGQIVADAQAITSALQSKIDRLDSEVTRFTGRFR